MAQRTRWGGSAWCEGALALIGARKPEVAESIRADLDELARTPSGLTPDPVITGDDLVEAGYQPGPEFGVWLEELYNAQLEGRLTTLEEALAWVASRGGGKS